MDEITYWILTKQAPCLMTYDNVIKKQFQAKRALLEVQSCHTISDDSNPPLPPQKKRRKLSILEDSGSTRDPQNVYFESSNPNTQEQTVPDSGKSESTISDIDLNTKKSSKQVKHKRLNLSKKSKTHNRSNKIVSSTPKVDAKPRRSLRNSSKKCLNDDSALETSLDIFDVSQLNGHSKANPSTSLDKEHERNARHKRIYKKLIFDEDADKKDKQMTKNKNENNKYDDMSDVSGFTANYIRSTRKKVNTKNKGNQNLYDEPKRKVNNTKMVVCINKRVNTGIHQDVNGPNCSTDSTNCLNLMTTQLNNKQTKVNRGTSILQFMPIKNNTSNSNLDTSKETNNMTNGSSRYPKRFKNSFIDYRCDTTTLSTKNSSHRRKNGKKMYSLSPTKRVNTTDSSVIKTRSRRSVLQPSDAVLVINNSTEQVSTPVSLNVASPKCSNNRRRKRKRSTLFLNRSRRSARKSNHIAGLSDSDDEKPLRPRYFS